MEKKLLTPRFMAEAGIIAALYFALTMASIPISYMTPQVRISEALCVLPFFTPAAVPGLFIGCLLSNLAGSPLGPYDILFGSLATLAAGVCHAVHPAQMAGAAACCGDQRVCRGRNSAILLRDTVLGIRAVGRRWRGHRVLCAGPAAVAGRSEKHKDKLFKRDGKR